MKNILYILSVLLLTTLLSFGQSSSPTITTNQWYKQGDMTLQIGPIITLPSLVNTHNQFGFSAETTYWQTLYTGTALEFGDFEVANFNPALIDHYSVLEKIRILPFSASSPFSRWDFLLVTGTDVRTTTGSKGVIIGAGSEIAITKSCRLAFNFKESFESVATQSGATVFAGLEWNF
jgi:hypothetical protein